MGQNQSFVEKKFSRSSPPWCVDGRPDYESKEPKGPQMLGASFNPLIVHAIYNNLDFDARLIHSDMDTLKRKGFGIGVHRGEHRHISENKSDCGAADKMSTIIETSLSNKGSIIAELSEAYDKNKVKFEDLDIDLSIFEDAFSKLNVYEINKIKINGEAAIAEAEKAGASVVNLIGSHQEEVAFVNLKRNVTLDTNKLNKDKRQAFNLDLLVAMEQSEALGVDRKFAAALSLILYSATKIVLNKQNLPVQVHA